MYTARTSTYRPPEMCKFFTAIQIPVMKRKKNTMHWPPVIADVTILLPLGSIFLTEIMDSINALPLVDVMSLAT